MTIKLKEPFLGFAKGEHFTYDEEWWEWTRQRSGQKFNLRGTVGEGEIAMLLSYLLDNKMCTMMEIVDGR